MEIRNKKEAIWAAAILGAEIGIAVAFRSYMFYKDGSNKASLTEDIDSEETLRTDGEADLPADPSPSEPKVPDFSPDPPASEGE